MTWWMWALSASLVWGIHYVLLGKALTSLSPVTMYWLPTIPLILFLPFYYKILVQDFTILMQSAIDVKLSTGISLITSFVASLLLYKAISISNATLASLIVISYPIFVAIFTFLLFDKTLLPPSVLVGGLLIMIGTGIVIYGN